MLTHPGAVAVIQRHHHTDGQRQRRAEVGVRDHRANGLIRQALTVGCARHDLSCPVESDAIAVGAALAVRGGAGQDDVRLDRPQRFVIQSTGPHACGRHVGDHDVGVRYQPTGDRPALVGRGVQRQRALVAIALQKGCAFAGLGDRLHPPILPTVPLLDADDVGAHVGQQGGTPRRGDEAAVVQHPYPVEDTHRPFPLLRHRAGIVRAAGDTDVTRSRRGGSGGRSTVRLRRPDAPTSRCAPQTRREHGARQGCAGGGRWTSRATR